MGHARTRDGAVSAPAPKRSRPARLQVDYAEDHENQTPTPAGTPAPASSPPSAAVDMRSGEGAAGKSARPAETASADACAENDTLSLRLDRVEHLIPQHNFSAPRPGPSSAAAPSGTVRVAEATRLSGNTEADEGEPRDEHAAPQAEARYRPEEGDPLLFHEGRGRSLDIQQSMQPVEGSEVADAPRADEVHELRDEIRAIARNPGLSGADRDHARQLIYLRTYRATRASEAEAFRARMHAQRFEATWSTHRDEATGERLHGCEHYVRNCKIRAPCCGMWVGCRHCHDHPAVTTDHEIDRFAIAEIMCMLCHRVQAVRRRCANAACGVEFARHFCARCKFYDGTPGKEIYHCDRCDICRVGKGAGGEFFHCDKCNACVSAAAGRSEHRCLKGSLDGNCPICSGCLRTSTAPVVFMRCGHALHLACFEQYTAHNYVCPLCSKTLTDMRPYYEEIDGMVAAQELPEEYREKKLEVLCHDCDKRSVTRYHFIYHKCQECKGYNTRVIAERPASEVVRVLEMQGASGDQGAPEERDEGEGRT